jgi:hypothetical protein
MEEWSDVTTRSRDSSKILAKYLKTDQPIADGEAKWHSAVGQYSVHLDRRTSLSCGALTLWDSLNRSLNVATENIYLSLELQPRA